MRREPPDMEGSCKCSRQEASGSPPAWGLSRGLTTHHPKNHQVTKHYIKPLRRWQIFLEQPRQQKMDMRFKTWNAGSLCRSGETDCSNYRGISLLPAMYKIPSNILISWLTPYLDEIIQYCCVTFNVTDQLKIRCSADVRYWGMKWGSAPVIYRVQESLCFSKERSTVQHYHWMCYNHKSSWADYNV
jgi:hypothetical protein